MACLLSRKACAAYLGVSLRTVRYWDAGRHQVPWAVVRLLRFVRLGDLGALEPAWAGFVLNRRGLFSPDGRCFPVDALRCWWQVVEQARFWREDYDRKAQARRQASRDRREPVTLAVPMPPDGGAFDLVHAADVEAQAVAREVVRCPVPPATALTASRPLAAATPPQTMPIGAGEPTPKARQAEQPHRAQCAGPAAGLSGPRVASRYARRRAMAQNDMGREAFEYVTCPLPRDINMVSFWRHNEPDIDVSFGGCTMREMALHCELPAVSWVPPVVPSANRGPTNLNGTYFDVNQTSLARSSCNGVTS